MTDKELLNMFVDEISTIRNELAGYVSNIMKGCENDLPSEEFKHYANAIDRIYGTAATVGMPEIADYCKAMKDVTYMASYSDNSQGKKKTLRMMIEAIQLLEHIAKCIFDSTQIKTIRNKMIAEVKRAERMSKQEFYNIDKKSI